MLVRLGNWSKYFYFVVVFIFFISWPVRTLGLSYDGEFIASGSEDFIIDIVSFIWLFC